MKIVPKTYTIKEISENYKDEGNEGVTGMNGKLNIRPKYQREFVYDEKKREAVIDTINKGFPLNVMYFSKNSDDTLEVLDGQQRIISFCQYVVGEFSYKNKYFHNLTKEEQKRFLSYECNVYVCDGNEKERLDWFEIINIAGEKLTNQELRNAVYTGTWLSNAKIIFSKNNCAAYLLSKDYVKGSPIRQELLQTAIAWICGSSKDENIREYMASHQHDENADELWVYYQEVINWIKRYFVKYRKDILKDQPWGELYLKCKNNNYSPTEIENKIQKLIQDDEVQNHKGIVKYILLGEEKGLNLRKFDKRISRATYEKQNGICPKCGKHFELNEMEADHIMPWSKGGKTIAENCQMLCKRCNASKSNKY